MKSSPIYFLAIVLLSLFSTQIVAQVSVEDQIKMALLAAPEESRAEAKVYGYDEKGEFVTLREGTNSFICIADDPSNDRFQVVSYHKDLDPFMARGRALKAEGKTPQEIFDIREEEAKAGTLMMPKTPATMHVYFGSDVSYNAEENKMDGARYRYVVYTPFATQESTGLPLKPNGSGHPWLMNPGTHRAHIMITPPAGN